MKQVNAIGDVCPLPVVKTKKAMAEMGVGQLEVLVDNDVAVQNVRRFAESSDCTFQVSPQDGHFRIVIEKSEAELPMEDMATAEEVQGKTVVVLSSEFMGAGDDALGKVLMKGFVFALTQLDSLPDIVLLYNTGAKLSVTGSTALVDLISLEKSGVKIMTCGTCLNHFGLTEQLAVGEVTNMYNIVEEMRSAGRLLRP